MTGFRCTCSVTQGRGDCPTPDECDMHAVPVRDRYAQCHGDCTTDCGACKGHGRPAGGTAGVLQQDVLWWRERASQDWHRFTSHFDPDRGLLRDTWCGSHVAQVGPLTSELFHETVGLQPDRRCRRCMDSNPTVGAAATTPVHDPGIDQVLDDVAIEVLRQDAAGEPVDVMRSRASDAMLLAFHLAAAARAVRSMRAIDQAAGGSE